MRHNHNGGRAKLAFATLLTLVAISLVGSSTASATPADNLRNAAKCLFGGWQTLHPAAGRTFPNLPACLIFALRGSTFYVEPPAGGQGQ